MQDLDIFDLSYSKNKEGYIEVSSPMIKEIDKIAVNQELIAFLTYRFCTPYSHDTANLICECLNYFQSNRSMSSKDLTRECRTYMYKHHIKISNDFII